MEIARGVKWPRDPCKRAGLNVVVNSIDAASLTPANTKVLVDLTGHVTLWACAKVLGAGIKTKVIEDDVRIAAPVELYLPDRSSASLRLAGRATLETGQPRTREAAEMLIGDVDAALTAQLGKLLDSDKARAAAPPLPGLDLNLESASLGEEDGQWIVKARGRAKLSSSAFTALMGYLTK